MFRAQVILCHFASIAIVQNAFIIILKEFIFNPEIVQSYGQANALISEKLSLRVVFCLEIFTEVRVIVSKRFFSKYKGLTMAIIH